LQLCVRLNEIIWNYMKWKTTEGEMKDIWRKSYIKKRPKGRWKIYDESHISKNDGRGDERYMTKVIYQWNEKRPNDKDKIRYDMALCIIISWETSPPLALGPWQDRSFQLRVGGLKPFAFWWRKFDKWLPPVLIYILIFWVDFLFDFFNFVFQFFYFT